MKKSVQGSLCLLLGTLIWGSAFVAQSVGMDHLGPFTFQTIRCVLAVIGLLPVIWLNDQRNRGRGSIFSRWADKKLWKSALLCAVPLFFAASLQQLGIQYTDAGKAAFLTAMYIVFVPIIGIFFRKKPSPMIAVSVILAVIGLYLLSCIGVTQVNKGDLFLLGCAFMFAVQITFIDRFASEVDALRLNCLQSLLCAIGSAVIMALTEQSTIPDILDCWFPLCYTGFLSMGAAYSLQILGQRSLEATTASLIMSLESVFAVIFGVLILHETMTAWEAAGCVLVFAAVILSQLPIRIKREKRKKEAY